MGDEPQSSDGKGDHWVAVQKKTFTKWVNNHLRKKSFSLITDVQTEFETGVKLMEIVNALYEMPFPKHNKAPKLRPHKLDNLEVALKMVEEAKIKTNFLKPTHLIDHDLKMILGMIWAIILDYAIKGISVDELTAKEGLLLWCQKKTAGYRDVDPPGIKGFTHDWKNGMAFCALIHRHQPQMLDYNSLSKANAKANLELAFGTAEKLGIPRLLDVEDMQQEKPDERSVMTYISEYFHRFAQQDVKELNARRVAKMVKFAREMNQQKSDYEDRAKALVAWVGGKIPELSEGKFGDSLDEANQAMTALRDYLVSEKPAKSGEKLDLEALFARIQTELQVNDRPPYQPPAELSPEAIDSVWDKLQLSEKKRGADVRANLFKFIKKAEARLSDEKVEEIKKAFLHFDKNNDNAMDKMEFKAANAALSVPFANDAAFNKAFEGVSEGKGTINLEQFTKYAIALQEDHDTPQQLQQAFRALADDADTITAAQLNIPPLTEADVKFLVDTMPSEGDKLDYKKFVARNFVQQ